MSLLTSEFLDKYKNKNPLTPLGDFLFYRTYSRFLTDKKRRESWLETCARSVEYNVSIAIKHMNKIGYKVNMDEMVQEAQDLFDAMFHTKQFISGRTLWIGGSENGVADKFPLANFNCSFTNISCWEDLTEMFYLLMVGAGVGFKSTPELVAKMKPIRTDIKVLHSEYEPVFKGRRLEKTKIVDFDNGYVQIWIGDSKEGWVSALKEYFNLISDESLKDLHTIKFNYNSVRPTGERLKTFGGTASGYLPLKEMFEKIDKAIKGELDTRIEPMVQVKGKFFQPRPIHILDIGNLIGQAVVVGGVRRSSQIFLMDSEDIECMLAKYGLNGMYTKEQEDSHRKLGEKLSKLKLKPDWFDKEDFKPKNNLFHRMMSNNSIVFEKKPSKDRLGLAFDLMRMEGEPGFWNAEEANRRRPGWQGGNPCAEILLDSKGVCNLTTVNLSAYVERSGDGSKYILDLDGLLDAQRRSARAGLRMTLLDLELDSWDTIQKRDRLTGTSMTGVQDAFSALKYTRTKQVELLKTLAKVAREESVTYAKELRVSSPLLVTTIKPEGTLSLVAGGVSPGLHAAHSPFYIRRIRITASDPLMKVVKELGWPHNPENGTPGDTREEQLKNARTMVIDFPVKTMSQKTKTDFPVEEQLETYFMFQKNYTDHNSSNTITVKPEEWGKCEDIIWNRWDEFLAVSFLAHDGGTYKLAPYEAIDEETYKELSSQFKSFDATLLEKYEKFETDFDLSDPNCETGICPVR